MNIICIHCKFAAITEIRRDELFGNGVSAVIIENIPMIKCQHCGIVYLEPKVSRMIDKICANPEQFSSLKEKLVAQYA
jgi:YgiT-type zinc finger domain-containing protein